MSDLQLNREELAWCAGFLDGEGHFAAKKNGKYKSLTISAHQIEPEVLMRLQRSLGGHVNGPYKSSRGHSDYWQWSTNQFETAQFVVAALWQWLSPVKRSQAHRALSAVRKTQATRSSVPGRRPKVPGEAIKEMRTLHSTGGWTQSALAERFSVSRGYVQKIVTNKLRVKQ